MPKTMPISPAQPLAQAASLARHQRIEWTAEIDALLGTMADAAIGARFGMSYGSIRLRRIRLGVPPLRTPAPIWTAKLDALLGTKADVVIAAQLGIGRDAVTRRRTLLAIPSYAKAPMVWTAQMDACLGSDVDRVIAKQLGGTVSQIRLRRQTLGIAAARPATESLTKVIARIGPLPEPAELPVVPTQRRFSIDQLQYRQAGGVFPDTEDSELTAYLERELTEMYSLSLRPIACPYCYSRRTMLAGKPHARMSIPRFLCQTCRRSYNRLTGTPLARLRHADKMSAFIRLLSQQLPYEEACKRLCVEYAAIANWTKKFRLWLLQLDPSGYWEAKVRLGIKSSPYIRCPRCGVDGEKRLFGIDPVAGRKLACPACHSVFSVRDAELLARQKVRLEVRYDPGKKVTKNKNAKPAIYMRSDAVSSGLKSLNNQ